MFLSQPQHLVSQPFLFVYSICFTMLLFTTYRAHPPTFLLSQRLFVHDICSQPLSTTCLLTPTLSVHSTFSQPHVFNNFVHNHTFSARPGSPPLGSARPGLARLGSAQLAPAQTCSTTPAHVHNTKNVHTPRRYRMGSNFDGS